MLKKFVTSGIYNITFVFLFDYSFMVNTMILVVSYMPL